MTTRTVHDPFHGKDVEISDRLVDRLRGKYASGPHLPNGNPEFGWRQFQSPPIQHEAADQIEKLEAACRIALDAYSQVSNVRIPGTAAGALVHARETLRRALGLL